jgi:capsular polysaccharide biosynthesis protein
MELRRSLEILLRRWWLIAALPALVLVGALLRTASEPYTATVRATILIPGDTETTGNADRPELMVLDDAPVLVGSHAFAGAVLAALPNVVDAPNLSVDQIQAALSATRYSRVLTITVKSHDERDATAIARAAQAALPDAVNQYMVAAHAQPATVKIIDPAGEATRGGSNRTLILIVEVLVAFAAGVGLAAFAAAIDERVYTVPEIEAALGLPVLADVRARRHPASRVLRLPGGSR